MGRTDLEKSEAINGWISRNTNRNSLQFLERGNEHPEWLPDGWNVDFKTRKSGPNMGAGYKCYINPLNGHKFYSKPEVLRYLETVNGSNCTFKNKKGCTVEPSLSNPSYAAKRQKLKHSASEQLFAGKEASDKGILEFSDGSSSKKEYNAKMSAENMVAPVPTDKTVVKMHSQEDTATNHAEIKECYTEKVNEENHSAPSISKKKKELNVPQRFSRRLAGIGLDEAANTVTSEQGSQLPKGNLRAPEYKSRRRSKKSEDSAVLLQQSEGGPAMELADKVSTYMNAPLSGDSSIESTNYSKIPPIIDEQLENRTAVGVYTEKKSPQHLNIVPKIESVHKMCGFQFSKPEHQYSPSLDFSATSLEVARKTITGELPAMGDPHSGNGLAPEVNFTKENKLHVSQIGNSGVSESSIKSNKSSTKKEHHNPCRASKRIAGIEPDVITNSIDCKRAPEYKSRRRSKKSEVSAVLLQQSDGGPAMEHADHVSSYINAPLSGDSSIESRKYSKIPPITDEQPENLGDEKMNDEKSEPQQSIASLYSWSDPCLEFAIKTLTGVLPIDDSVGSGPNLAPGIDLFEKSKSFECAKESSRDGNLQVNLKKSKNKKVPRLPRRLSNRLAGHEPELVPALRALEYSSRKSRKDKPTEAVVLTNGESVQLDASKETKLTLDASDSLKSRIIEEPSNKCEKSYEVQTVEESSKSEKLYETENVPKEQQQKLETEAGSETQLCSPVEKAIQHTSGSLETRVLEDSSNKSGKTYEAQTVGEPNKSGKLYECLTEVNSKTKLSLPYGKETEHIILASGSLETKLFEDSTNKSEQSYKAQTVFNERQKLEAENFVDVRSEPETCLPFADFWSDPCLEFAIKTLTGALPVDAAAEILPVVIPDISKPTTNKTHDQPVKELLHSIDEESHYRQSQKKKETNLVSQPSEQLLRQPEMSSSSIFCENASKFVNSVSYNSVEADLKSNLDDGESLREEAGIIRKLAHQHRNGNMLIHEEPPKKIQEVLGVKAFPAEQPEFGTPILSNVNLESEFCSPFMDSWSDPCLEFAFKTLTGAITVEENLPIQGCFQESVSWREQSDSGPALPDFGSTSFSQSDIASYYDVGDKSLPLPGQQSSTSLNGCAGYDPKEDYSRFSKDFQGR
ncbi:methyl-CpG-binding domain-containing protein 13-like isoform X1 [Senna tora]|uniref:Methyl-CpG-binding domain-containing protein 13-like isoform X1 n=1 Tax=Senna tora TaxID=362788 RepID=A0A834TX05_9FABA|nr:methyl-CpG-binding domain-containing protein 13-like isoform X1 [Senna tora]